MDAGNGKGEESTDYTDFTDWTRAKPALICVICEICGFKHLSPSASSADRLPLSVIPQHVLRVCVRQEPELAFPAGKAFQEADLHVRGLELFPQESADTFFV